MNRNLLCSLVILIFFCSTSVGQSNKAYISKLQKINILLSDIKYLPTDKERLSRNNEVRTILVEIIKNPSSFYDKFDSLKYMGKRISPDKKFAIITWNIPLINAKNVFYGYLQIKPKKDTCVIYPLNDISDSCATNPVFEQFTPERWFGALYYEIIPRSYSSQTVYTLIGSRLNNLMTNKKIIESLYFDENDKPIFGIPIFEYGLVTQCRVIFEFNIMARMTIHYNEKYKMIVFDHLAPPSSLFAGIYKYYGPDASYDAFYFENNIWKYFPKINIKNK